MNIDGTDLRQITNLGGSNWAPFYLGDNQRLIFSSNFNATGGNFGAFDLYLINENGENLERVIVDFFDTKWQMPKKNWNKANNTINIWQKYGKCYLYKKLPVGNNKRVLGKKSAQN